MEATNAPVLSRFCSTSTTSPPPEGRKSILSLVESGERPGNCQNKRWRRILLDINIHPRRTEAMVVSFREPQAFKRAIIRESKAASSASDDVADRLRMAQYTGVCPSMSGSCRMAEKSRPLFLQACEHLVKTEMRSSSDELLSTSRDLMEDLTTSFASACDTACPTACSSVIRSLASSASYVASSVAFQAACFAICAVALRVAFDSFRAENGWNTERGLVIWVRGDMEGNCDGETTWDCGDSEGVEGEEKRGAVWDDWRCGERRSVAEPCSTGTATLGSGGVGKRRDDTSVRFGSRRGVEVAALEDKWGGRGGMSSEAFGDGGPV